MNRKRLALMVLCLGLGMAGCSEESVLPTQVTPDAVAMGGPGLGDFASKWIGPAGGHLRLPGVRLEIPAGALAVSTLISIEKEADGSVDLSPDGQTFAVPVALTFDIEPGQDPEAMCVQWYDPDEAIWTIIPSASSQSARSAPLAHFSIYRITLFE